MATERGRQLTLRLSAADNVSIALQDLSEGEVLEADLTVRDSIPRGHKLSIKRIRLGDRVLKYGHVIGVATADIEAGRHVHSHNLAVADEVSIEALQASQVTSAGTRRDNLTFQGYRRPSGGVGTRNQVGVFASVNCSATVVHAVVDKARTLLLPKYPNVDAIAPIAHQTGCGMGTDDLGFSLLQRTMRGFLNHPNFGATLVIGLGCEVTGSASLVPDNPDPSRYRRLDIQEVGGTGAAIQMALHELDALLAVANSDYRESVAASELVVGLQCGGSDGLSGVTANPAMGLAVDRLVAAGGSALLSETPEIFGAESLLLSRAQSAEVAAALREKIAWWLSYAHQNGVDLNNNPSPGNKAGGLTTILEKSLGAVAKSGSSVLRDVIDYAQAVRTPGLTFMDSPGFDPCSATGQVASGANLLLFSTGRGSCFGCKPAPSIKLATNSQVYRSMADDMDVDCGLILSGTPMAEVADEITALLLAVASGQKSKSEALGYGDHEFVPWRLGAVL